MPVGWFGITRIARITGLDRSGVEVACAIRPAGHILQVTNGKGLTFRAAAARAESEAAELWAAETIDPERLRWSSWEELQRRGFDALHPLKLGSAGEVQTPALWSPALRLAWSAGTNLFDGRPVRVPAQAVHCGRQNDWSLGPQIVRWTTNGMGAHPRRAAAILHALLEAVERDQLAHALPQGWTAGAISTRVVQGSASLKRLLGRMRRRGLMPFLFDLTPGRGLGLPLAGALLFDTEGGPIPLTAGYACHPEPERARLGALLEAAQSRLTDVHGAREDVAPADRGEAERLYEHCRRAQAREQVREARHGARTPGRREDPLREVMRRLWARGHGDAVVVDLAPANSPLRVVKVVVPRFRVSELL